MADEIDRKVFDYMTTATDKTAVDFSGRKSRNKFHGQTKRNIA